MISIFLPIKKKSERLPDKNIFRIKNYKLGLTEIKLKQIKKLVTQLKKKKLFTEVIVSSDSEIIKKYVSKFKWITFHDRPDRLIKDISVKSLIKEAGFICKGKYILWTHVTSPLFNHNDYLLFINKFINQKKYTSAFSSNLIQDFMINEDGKWISHNFKLERWPRTQDLKKVYQINNCAFISTKKNYQKNGDRLSLKMMPIITKKSSQIDIDDLEDYELFKKII
jgi:CMP-N-acetylneuraminic acid synthetase